MEALEFAKRVSGLVGVPGEQVRQLQALLSVCFGLRLQHINEWSNLQIPPTRGAICESPGFCGKLSDSPTSLPIEP